MGVSPQFNCSRMVAEYHDRLYSEAHRAWTQVREENFQSARDKSAWSSRLADAWERVRFTDLGALPIAPVLSGKPVQLRAAVDLANLAPSDVRLEALVGRINPQGFLESTEVIAMKAVDMANGSHVFGAEYVPRQTGRLGYALRVAANHYENPLTRPCHPLIRWS